MRGNLTFRHHESHCNTSGSDEADSGTIYNVTSTSYRAFRGCSIYEGTVEEFESLNFFEDNDWRITPIEYVVKIEDNHLFLIGCHCLLLTKTFLIGTIMMLMEMDQYDFTEIVEDFVDECGSEGGYLYKLSL